MVAGFVVDNIFFKRVDFWQTHAVFAAYILVCFISIPLFHFVESRAAAGAPRPRWRSIVPIVTQFALGGLWSGFFVLYGRSAVLAVSWPFLLLLVVVLVGNEFFRRYHERLVFTSTLFFLALYSYAIFAVPIWMRSIDTVTFLMSGAVALALFGLFTVVLRILGRTQFRADVGRIRAGALAVFLIVNLFYFTNVLPPLPLSAKAAGVYHAVWREPGAYLAKTEQHPWQVAFLGFAPTLHVVQGESVYAYSAVFASTDLSTTIVHRWQWHDPDAGAWVTRAAIAYPVVGGRDGGYRGYSAVLIRLAGEWRVNIETADGRVIERLRFNVELASLPPVQETLQLK